MKNIFILSALFCLSVSCAANTPDAQLRILAFPGAEGFGKYTTGGREGKVLIVENLNDSGTGSLRSAVEEEAPRIIVFNVSGTISLESPLKINHGDLTIAGQSAPGDGVCIKNYPLVVSADNVIIRYLRVRMGDEREQQADCLTVLRNKNIMIDHCSFSWGTDEVLSAYDNENLTVQYCIISESLNNSVHEKGEHGYGGIWGGKGATFHHNLLAHHISRLPRFCGSRYHNEPRKEIVDFRNNIIYNWRSNNVYAGEQGNHNLINNYYKYGPATEKSKRGRILNPYVPYGKFYIKGNYLFKFDEVTKNNKLGVVADDLDSCLIKQPIKVVNIKTQTALEAFETVLEEAGANMSRDETDTRIISEVRAGTASFGVLQDGIIDSQTDVGAWPVLKQYNKKPDSDSDGMPDAWELNNGLDPSNPDDNSLKTLNGVYTNIEVYLDELTN